LQGVPHEGTTVAHNVHNLKFWFQQSFIELCDKVVIVRDENTRVSHLILQPATNLLGVAVKI
jgi:hypothetical protein